MNDLQIFNSEEFGEIRTVTIDGKPYFCGSDVAKALGYAKPNNAISQHCRATLKQGIPISGKMQDINFISEGDLYRLITHSKLELAEKFEAWVFDEVIPSIRKNGGYILGQENLTSEQLMAQAVLVAQQIMAERDRQLAEKDMQIVEMTPKAGYFDRVVDRNLLTNIRDTAKELGVKERAFTRWLEEEGYLYRDSHNNLKPFAPYITGDKKYFEIKEWSNERTAGTQTLVTPRGREAFRILLPE